MARFPRTRMSVDMHSNSFPAETAVTAHRSITSSVDPASGVVIVRVPHVLAKTKMSRSKLYSLLNPNSPYFDPTFPKKAVIGTGPRARTVGWRLHEIDAWINAQFFHGYGGQA